MTSVRTYTLLQMMIETHISVCLFLHKRKINIKRVWQLFGDFSGGSHKIFGIYKPPTHWYFAGIEPLTVESLMEISHLDIRHEFQANVIANSIS